MFRTLAVSLLSLLLCASVAFAEKPLVVASDPTFPPNEMLNKDKEIVGFSIDYIKAVGKEAGFDVTQATVSRDIRELKLTKVPTGNGRQKYTILVHSDHYLSDKYIRVLKDGYVSMDVAQNILVVKTVSGMAMAVAAAIDAIKLKEIVGCIAGDDTIMLVLHSESDAIKTMENIKEAMES